MFACCYRFVVHYSESVEEATIINYLKIPFNQSSSAQAYKTQNTTLTVTDAQAATPQQSANQSTVIKFFILYFIQYHSCCRGSGGHFLSPDCKDGGTQRVFGIISTKNSKENIIFYIIVLLTHILHNNKYCKLYTCSKLNNKSSLVMVKFVFFIIIFCFS